MQVSQYQEEAIKFKMQVKDLERKLADKENEVKSKLGEVKRQKDESLKS